MREGAPIGLVTRERQASASDPASSAWVSANAGSGKTHVLTQRVLRLLLSGAKPSQILCLTYTKAAAANMSGRLFKILAEWTSLDDDALLRAIADIGATARGPADLELARRLFARTIETPGGLKVQTLHAFCERLLHLFPFEANVAAHFRVLDEREVADLIAEARKDEFKAMLASPAGRAALAEIAELAGVGGFDPLLHEALARRNAFAAFDSPEAYGAALAGALGLAAGTTLASLEAAILGGGSLAGRRSEWARRLDRGSTRDREMAARLRAANAADDQSVAISLLFEAFFIKDGEGEARGGASGRLITKGLGQDDPSLEIELKDEILRLDAMRRNWRAAACLERSQSLFAVVAPILRRYAEIKGERGLLDFDDLIARALELVTRVDAAWVLHKLDYGLDHILIDEAQDTSPAQWRILAALCEDFFAGLGARPVRRTLFAVGDEKQSIFSFQGAAPEKFGEMRHYFRQRLKDAGLPFVAAPLNVSFRSSKTILAAVDMTFAREEAWRGVSFDGAAPMPHSAYRESLPGVVELWPVVSPTRSADREDWRMPLDEPARDDPAVIVAKRIADTLAGWLAPGSLERVCDKKGEPRPIRPSDIMILVRKRSAFFEAMIRALKSKEIKAAGADRLMLRDHIAVMDLLAVGRAALLPEDDLTLASALKSPLLGCDDEDLFAFATRRPGSLAAALAASGRPAAIAAGERLRRWRRWARALSPYDFYARILGEGGGRRALLGRLGPDASDPLDEFLAQALAHEQREAPSLQAFLREIETTDIAIKRDMEGEGDGVRVLTVHASKGLEAPIVFLPDTCGAPSGRNDPRLLPLSSAASDLPIFAWAARAARDSPALAAARQSRREADANEHRRLLYVAMTRAEQRLIVAGFEGGAARKPDCWYELVRVGVAAAMAEAPSAGDGQVPILRMGAGAKAQLEPAAPRAPAPAAAPSWLTQTAADEARAASVAPSQIAAPQISDPTRIREGLLSHALLQFLPGVDAKARRSAAEIFLRGRAGALSAERRRRLAEAAIATIEAPDLAALFTPGSRSEIAVAGEIERPGRGSLPFSGRLDRLATSGDEVLIADFKSGPAPDAPPEAYTAQLALYRAALQPLYPKAKLRALLVYVDGPRVFRLDDRALDQALAKIPDARQ